MRTRGAIIRQTPGQYEVVDLELSDPQAGEIQVRMAAAGLCHSDDHLATGDSVAGIYPFAGGHEGAGVVTAVGAGVREFHEGDHVVFSFLPSCGRCRWCATGRQNLCQLGATLLQGSRLHDPTDFRLSLDGEPVGQMCGVSTFCEHTTVAVESAIKLPKDVPLELACLVGCGVGTGWGSAVNSAGAGPGDTVIVMGVGGIGMNAVQGAAHVGASHVIAVDPIEFKRTTAMALGATHAVPDLAHAGEMARELTGGQGADAVVVAVGVTAAEHITEAFAAIRKAGTVVVTGIGHKEVSQVALPLAELTLFQKRIQGSLFGEMSPTYDVPRLIALYQQGHLRLEELITTTYSLDEIAQGYRDMHTGRNIRGVVRF